MSEPIFLNFFNARNLLDSEMVETAPWQFSSPAEQLSELRRLKKDARRAWTGKADSCWNVYSAVRGVSARLRISKDNHPAAIRGLVVDYDASLKIDAVRDLISKIKTPAFVPNFIEVSLGGNYRLVWVFEREVLVPNPPFASLLLETLIEKMRADKLLPGFDQASAKPSTVWTNGGEWHKIKDEPVPYETLFGIVCSVSEKSEFGSAEIPLSIVHAEVEKRYPKRWNGPFELNNTGVRFWDDAADCPTGCQVKPDGMLCFTGRVPFQKWEQIFGAEWCNSQRAVNLGKAAGDTYFDGRQYWQLGNEQRWESVQREDLKLWLRCQGFSAKPKLGQSTSEVDRVLCHIQKVNRVGGAAPIINRAPGITHLDGKRILNTSTIRALVPAEGLVTPEVHFNWLWQYLNHLFDCPDRRAVDHFLAWLRRFYLAVKEHEPHMGQAVFLCGPPENGKTLLGYRVIKPLVGDRAAHPFAYFTGLTDFNSELFESPLLVIDDEEAITNESTRQKFMARIKSFVVNPSQKYHEKFLVPVSVEWTGRFFGTMNDDPSSIGLLPEVHESTQDKMMFFASRPRPKSDPWPENRVLEQTIAKELPYFAKWLTQWTPPDSVIASGRMGVKSYFDPRLLGLSLQQNAYYQLREVLKLWVEMDPYWGEDNRNETWDGDPTRLFSRLSALETLQSTMREWTSVKCAKALKTLAKFGIFGVEFVGGSDRIFRISRAAVLNSAHASVGQGLAGATIMQPRISSALPFNPEPSGER